MAHEVREVVYDPRRNGAPICTALWPDGNPCKLIAVRGTTKCRRHGGKSPRGIAASNFQHGRYSKDLPTRLAARAAAAGTNPRLLSLSDDIAVVEGLLAEQLAMLDTGETSACWQALRATRRRFHAARATGDLEAMEACYLEEDALITQGGRAADARAEIRRFEETRAKLVQTEMKTLQSMQHMVTTQQMLLWLGAITQEVTDAVKAEADARTARKILMRVQTALTRLATLEERR